MAQQNMYSNGLLGALRNPGDSLGQPLPRTLPPLMNDAGPSLGLPRGIPQVGNLGQPKDIPLGRPYSQPGGLGQPNGIPLRRPLWGQPDNMGGGSPYPGPMGTDMAGLLNSLLGMDQSGGMPFGMPNANPFGGGYDGMGMGMALGRPYSTPFPGMDYQDSFMQGFPGGSLDSLLNSLWPGQGQQFGPPTSRGLPQLPPWAQERPGLMGGPVNWGQRRPPWVQPRGGNPNWRY